MEVNQEVLQKLICSVCKEHLSVGPVMLLPNGPSVCGRCPAPDATIDMPWNAFDEVALRNLPYEYLAEQLLFPCRNAKHGCKVKRVFGEVQNHEEECEFRPYNCCISETNNCKWIGTKDELLQHCNDTHPQQVVQNPATFEYDIFKSSVNNYLMTVFQMLFLIHTKVCMASKQIYHCVRLLGDSSNIGNFNYTLVITNGDTHLTKKSVVSKQGCLAIKEDDSFAIGINSLLDIFTNFKDATVILTVNKLIEKTEQQTLVVERYCTQCGTNVTNIAAYFDKDKWFCSECIDNKHVCAHVECSFEDTENKLFLHATFYCRYKRYCPLCYKYIDVSLDQHYQASHANITYLSGEIFLRQTVGINKKVFIITSEFGRLHCQFGLCDDNLKYSLCVCSPIDSGNLLCYTCEMQLQNPATGLTIHKMLSLLTGDSDLVFDWQLKIDKEEIMQYVYKNQFKIAVTITKTK